MAGIMRYHPIVLAVVLETKATVSSEYFLQCIMRFW